MSDPRVRVLYISYNGLGTPLVRSQVLPYLSELSSESTFDLITYERSTAQRPPADEIGRTRTYRLAYHKRPALLAKAIDVALGVVVGTWLVLRHDIKLLHARSHVAAAVAAVVGSITRRPFIFDMRGFLAEEFVEAGAWRSGGLRHRLVRAAERLLLRGSSAVVVLTDRARQHLRTDDRYRAAVEGKDVTVVPCCVDLGRFDVRSTERRDALVYVGSIGTWYLLDEMIRFFELLAAARPSFTFDIANLGERELVAEAAARSPLRDRISVQAVAFDAIPAFLASRAAGIVLLTEGGAKIASSPIKVAEYLAAGLPVVVNEIVGDTPALLRRHDAGVVVGGLDDAHLAEGARDLARLLEEGPPMRARARELAEREFDLRTGAHIYSDLYRRVLGPR